MTDQFADAPRGVRATSKAGQVQTGVEQDVLPDGATGWHSVDFTVSESDG